MESELGQCPLYIVTSHANHEMSDASVFLIPFLSMDMAMFRKEHWVNDENPGILMPALPSCDTVT